MTCVVLVKNPDNDDVLALTQDDEHGEECIAQWSTWQDARKDAIKNPLVKAWGGYIVDLDGLDVIEI